MRRFLRIERHALGPRVYAFGVRVHEWQLGVALLVVYSAAAGWGAVSLTSVPALGFAGVGGWFVLKDWRDLCPSLRDTGAWQLGFHRPPAPLRALRRLDSLPGLAALLAAVIGTANLVWALSPGGSWLDDLLPHGAPFESTPIFASLALPAGVVLLVGAFYLLRRRRAAWATALTLLLLFAGVELLRGRDLGEAGLSLGAAGILWWARDAFCVRPRERAVVLFGRVGALLGGFLALVFATVVAIVHTGAGAQSAEEALALLAWHPAGPTPLFDEAAALPVLIRGTMILVLLAATYLAFRSPALREPSTDRDRGRAVDLVRVHGSDTLAFFKLRRDTQRLFSADGQAFLAYRIEAGVLLLSGDPVGSASAIPDLLRLACAYAEERGLRLAVLGAGREFLPLYEQAGLRAFYLGDEAIVETTGFALEGRAIRKVRQSVNRLERAGYAVTVQPLGAISRDDLLEFGRISKAWLHGKPERGFAMALDELDPAEHADTLVASARDSDGIIRAFLHFVPTYGRPAVSLSAMRREPLTPNGLTEFLVVKAVEALRGHGVDEVSLNFATFARALYAPRDWREQLLARLISFFDRYFQIERLYRFNAKFFPRWEPRYLLYEGRLGLARAALAALWAEGQLPRSRGRAARRPGRNEQQSAH
jgi:lysyl-tRNA synthetase class 2